MLHRNLSNRIDQRPLGFTSKTEEPPGAAKFPLAPTLSRLFGRVANKARVRIYTTFLPGAETTPAIVCVSLTAKRGKQKKKRKKKKRHKGERIDIHSSFVVVETIGSLFRKVGINGARARQRADGSADEHMRLHPNFRS